MLYVLDASAVLNDFLFSFTPGNEYLVTSGVMGEFKDLRSKQLAENALHNRLLKIAEPTDLFSKRAEELVKKHGFTLSKQDISILALSMELMEKDMKFEVLTDDYSLQNFLKLLKIPFSGVIHGKIKRVVSLKKAKKTR